MSTELHTIATARQPRHAFVHVNSERCAGCQECLRRCPTQALSMDTERWIVQAEDLICVGCRQCERVCPYSAISVTGPLVVAPRTEQPVRCPEPVAGDVDEVKPGFADWSEALAEAQRCLRCPDATCIEACPAHNDIPSFIAALREQDLAGAHEILRETSVLPDICSRVCDTSIQCEGACSSGESPTSRFPVPWHAARSRPCWPRVSTCISAWPWVLTSPFHSLRRSMTLSTRQRHVNQPPKLLRGTPERLEVDRVIFALGYRVDAEVAREVAELPVPKLAARRIIADRRWIASGIFGRSPERVGIPALERDTGLAVATLPVGRGWWANLWRQQAAAGEAAARVPREDRIWVVGDALVGPSTVAGAMAHGREAARAVMAQRSIRHRAVSS